jgi:DNA replication protein DnaC
MFIQYNGEMRELDQEDYERMMLPRRFWTCTPEGVSREFDASESEMSAFDFLSRYFENFETYLNMGCGALLWGNNGCGKTGIAALIAKMARRAKRVVLFVAAADLKRMVIDKDAFDESESMWDRACSVDLLVLDDLGKGTEDRTGFGMRLLDDLIRKRSAASKVTIITTNTNPDSLEEILKLSTKETLKECTIVFQVTGPDLRVKGQARITEMFYGTK